MTSTHAPVSVAACQCHAAKQTVRPSPCPSYQLWEKCTGIMYRILCAVQELILHTTSLIPIERPVIPHLQSQISSQSSLFYSTTIIPLCNITSAKRKCKKKGHYERKSCKQMEIWWQFPTLMFIRVTLPQVFRVVHAAQGTQRGIVFPRCWTAELSWRAVTL